MSLCSRSSSSLFFLPLPCLSYDGLSQEKSLPNHLAFLFPHVPSFSSPRSLSALSLTSHFDFLLLSLHLFMSPSQSPLLNAQYSCDVHHKERDRCSHSSPTVAGP
ncbi:hypothetical protein XENORESO_014466 [Xenotaenia resolanae]|uniref:Uncharacterized protein n=1 Tax=Xenotaenia resolanae TaxID=208358 RepID=A0ABV0W912_9TELE